MFRNRFFSIQKFSFAISKVILVPWSAPFQSSFSRPELLHTKWMAFVGWPPARNGLPKTWVTVAQKEIKSLGIIDYCKVKLFKASNIH